MNNGIPYDPGIEWNFPTEPWQQDDAIVDKPLITLFSDGDDRPLFRSVVTQRKFSPNVGTTPIGYAIHSSLSIGER